jgi:hypothetical protein
MKAIERAITWQSAKLSNMEVLEAQLNSLGKGSTMALAQEIGEVRKVMSAMQAKVWAY